MKLPDRKPSYGRNQLLLDLVNPAVRDYIVENVTRILDSCPISYVKWDMNRHMSDMYSQAFVNFMGTGFTYVNREDDAGDEGIRYSKLNYKPIELIGSQETIPYAARFAFSPGGCYDIGSET